MSIKEGNYEFRLSRPLEYSMGGNKAEAEMVMLFEPSMEHVKYYLKLKQLLTRSQMELAKSIENLEELQDMAGQQVKSFQDEADKIELQADEMFEAFNSAINAAETVDAGQFLGTFAKMVLLPSKKPIAKVDGRVVMTSVIWGNLNPDDAWNMALRWCTFFAMPSLEGKMITSETQPESAMQRTEA